MPASAEGEQAIQGFQIPEYLKPSLVAAEPSLANPVAFCVDEQGRFYIAETFRQKKGVEDNRSHMDWLHDDLAAQSVADRVAFFKKHLGDKVNDYAKEQDRIRLLEDTDGDGVVDRATIYADGFNAIEDGTGAGLLAHEGNVYYTCIPKLYRLRDNDGDGRSDVRETLHDGYGVRVAFRGHDMHGLTLGPDGRIYFQHWGSRIQCLNGRRDSSQETRYRGRFRCELDGTHLEVFAYGLRNPQELAFDNYGNLFTGDNNSDSGDQARWVYVVQDGDTGWRMYYQYLPDRGPWNRERMWYPHKADPETEQKQPAYIVPPVANLGDGPSGLTYYPGIGLPERYQNHFFMADFRGSTPNSGIRSFSVASHGASFKLTDSHEFLWSILATDVDFGYDGSLYLTDWVNGWDGPGKGRLYRFSSEEDTAVRSQVASMFARGFDQLNNEELFDALSHRRPKSSSKVTIHSGENEFRTRNSHLIIWRKHLLLISLKWRGFTVSGGLVNLLRTSHDSVPLMDSLGRLCDDSDEEIRSQVARVLGDATDSSALDLLRTFISQDSSPRVRHLAALSFGRVYHNGDRAGDTAASDISNLLALLRDAGNEDPVLRHSAVMALVGIGKINSQWLAASIPGAGDSERMGILLALRRLKDPGITLFLDDSNPELILSAARAIHDEPMEDLTGDLAGLIDQKELRTIDPLMRRIIHSAYRVGNKEYAASVGRGCRDGSVSLPVRIFAAELLSEWNQPGPLDRVIGSWRPLERDSIPELNSAIKPHLAGLLSADEKLRALGIQLASKYEIRDVNPMLWSIYQSDAESVANRVSALEALAALNTENLSQAIEFSLSLSMPRYVHRDEISCWSQIQTRLCQNSKKQFRMVNPWRNKPPLRLSVDSVLNGKSDSWSIGRKIAQWFSSS